MRNQTIYEKVVNLIDKTASCVSLSSVDIAAFLGCTRKTVTCYVRILKRKGLMRNLSTHQRGKNVRAVKTENWNRKAALKVIKDELQANTMRYIKKFKQNGGS